MKSAEYLIEKIADAGHLTERQAQIYVLREIEGRRRQEIADELDLSPHTVTDYLGHARKKVESARQTVEILDSVEKTRKNNKSMIPDRIEVDQETIIDARMKEWAHESGGGKPQTNLDIIPRQSGVDVEMYAVDNSSHHPKGIGISPRRFLEEHSDGLIPPYEDWGEMQNQCKEHEKPFDECWKQIEEVERENVEGQLADEIQPHPRGRDELGGIEVVYTEE